jgi:hypothetical protein
MHTRYRDVAHLIPKDFFVFSIVRNPWDRFLSLSRIPRYRKKLTMDQFIEKVRVGQEKHYHGRLCWPQTEWLFINGKMAADNIMRFERLDQDFPRIMKIVGIGAELPHFNNSYRDSERPKYREAFTPSQADQIADIYRKDIDAFGYRF